jgi:uncharacterized protein YkwD
VRRIRLLVASSVIAVSAFVAAPVAAEAAECKGADTVPSATTHETHATLCLLNQQRRAHGLRPLRLDGKLNRAARAHARDMVAKRYFAHESKNGATFASRIKRTGWTKSRRSYTMGENIAWGGGSLSTPREIVRSWMGSAGHRANILARQFRFVGIGIAAATPEGGDGGTYATDFGG